MDEEATIEYQGGAWSLKDPTSTEWKEVTFEKPELFTVVEFVKADASACPFAIWFVEQNGNYFAIEDEQVCRYYGMCPVCRREDCNNKCLPPQEMNN